ncbi:MAG: roadblock/LC7 domain-containing protein [Candidatus Hodarchaeales archaeon]
MKENLHSLITMLENTFSDINGCIALIDEDGLTLYSTHGCGDMITFEATSSIMARNLFSARERIKSIDSDAGLIRNATFRTEKKAFYICEVDENIFFIVIASNETYDKMRLSLDKFMSTWRAIKMLQEADYSDHDIVEDLPVK